MFYMANCEQGGFFFSKMLSERALLFGRPEYLPFALLARKTLLTHKNLKFFLMPFTSPKMFCAGPNFLSQHKNLTAFSASSKTFVPAQKPILLNANHLFVWHKIFVTATICK